MSSIRFGRLPGTRWFGDRSVRTKVLTSTAAAAVVAGTVGVIGLTALSDCEATS